MKLGIREPYNPKNPDHNNPEKYVLYSGSVYDHVISALRNVEATEPIVNLSVLLHDVGKQKVHTRDEKGDHYFGHAEEAKEIIEQIAERLKLDLKSRDALLFGAMNHMKMHEFLKMSNSNVIKLMESPYWDVLKATAEADARARGSLFDDKEWSNITNRISKLAEGSANRKQLEAIKKVVNGKWIMDLRNIKGGPAVGKIISDTVSWIQDNEIDIYDVDKIKEHIMGVEI